MVAGAKSVNQAEFDLCRENPSRLRRFRTFPFILPLNRMKREESREVFVRNELLLPNDSIGGWFLSMQEYIEEVLSA